MPLLAAAMSLMYRALVAAGLDALGLPHRTVAVPDWQPWLALADRNVAGIAVFNLMEAPPVRPEALLGAAAALELMGLPFTGSASGVRRAQRPVVGL